jgi:hypothetical protein
MDDAAPPLLLFVVGPPAVGKMSVGQAITERIGLRLFHNHLSIEIALRYFDYGTPAFRRIDAEIRRRIIEEVAASDLPGLAFTLPGRSTCPRTRNSSTSTRGRSAHAARACCSLNLKRPRLSG